MSRTPHKSNLPTRIPSAAFSVGAVLLAWAIVSMTGSVSPLLLPSPRSVLHAAWSQATDRALMVEFCYTATRTLCALLVASSAIPIGLALSQASRLRQATEPIFNGLRSVPATALFPLVLLVLGVGEQTIVLVAAYPAMLVMIVSVLSASSHANPRRVAHAEALGLGRGAMVRHVLFWESLPSILSALRVGASYALVLVIALEMFIGVGNHGLGRRIYDLQATYQMADALVAIFAAAALGIGLNGAISMAEKRVLSWSSMDAKT